MVDSSDDFKRIYEEELRRAREYAINVGEVLAMNKELAEKSREINWLNEACGLRINKSILRSKI